LPERAGDEVVSIGSREGFGKNPINRSIKSDVCSEREGKGKRGREIYGGKEEREKERVCYGKKE
jgi:hypothetical protein